MSRSRASALYLSNRLDPEHQTIERPFANVPGFQTQVSSLCNMGEFGQNRLQQVIFRFDGAQNGVVGRGFNGMWETKELDLFFSLP